MNFKTCQKLHDNFVLDNKFEVFLAVRDLAGEVVKKVPLKDPLEKGYVYAALYFFDEVQREVNKLQKRIEQLYEEITADLPPEQINPPLLKMSLSTRVRQVVGNDSLDGFIKEFLAQKQKHIALIPDAKEIENKNIVIESIFVELLENFFNMTLSNTSDVGGKKVFTLKKEYIASLTERQKMLLAPAIKMVGFINQLNLNQFQILADYRVSYVPVRMPQPFVAKEEEMKNSIKKFMGQHLLDGNPEV